MKSKASIWQKLSKYRLGYGILILIVLGLSAYKLANLSPYRALIIKNANQTTQQSAGEVEYVRAKVVSVKLNQPAYGDQNLQVKLLDGLDKNQTINIDRNYILGDPNSKILPVGSEVVLTIDPNNGNQYSFLDRYRIPGAITILVVLILLVTLIGHWRGFTALVGLVISICILAIFVVPRIIAGDAAFATCIEGAFMIATVSIFIAHGFNKRTTIAFICTLLTLVLIIFLATLVVHLTGVIGNPSVTVNSDQEVSLLEYSPHYINLMGLFMGGLVIASLGVLEDITTGQAAAVDEVLKSNPKLSISMLYKKGLSVGREHVAALINTLGIVYAGTALPTIILTVLYSAQGPLAITLNGETIMEAFVRAVVPSIGLLLAVPLTTIVAAYYLPKWYSSKHHPTKN